MRRNVAILLILSLALAASGCSKHSDRSSYPQQTVVTIFYGAGFNNLSSDIKNNIKTTLQGDLPFPGSRHVFLSFAHLSVSDTNFSELRDSYLIKYTKDFGKISADTLYRVDGSRTACDPAVLEEVLRKVAELYPDAKYGLVMSSHGTGWLPAYKYSTVYQAIQYSARQRRNLPIYDRNADPDEPKVKTFGAEVLQEGTTKYSQEMTIQSMAKAIPVHLEYIVFDACLMGCVEVAYELKDVTDVVVFSPTEILSYGFNYKAFSLLFNDNPDAAGLAREYYEYYAAKNGRERSATISVVRTDKLEALAALSAGLFGKYRTEMAGLNSDSGVQEYFRGEEKHWFYDFRDILVTAGASVDDILSLDTALNECIIYKAATPSFLGLQIDSYSGLSMYLPSVTKDDQGVAGLNAFYKTLAWNKATNLVE